MQDQKFRLIDLFSSAGGFTLGFAQQFQHRIESVWANDFNRAAAQTYNANFGNHCVDGDIIDLLEDSSIDIPDADIVIGGPPCQGFSLLNKNRKDDPRKHLWRPYLDIVEQCGARIFVIENVRQLLNTPEYDAIVEAAGSWGLEWPQLCYVPPIMEFLKCDIGLSWLGRLMQTPTIFFHLRELITNLATAW